MERAKHLGVVPGDVGGLHYVYTTCLFYISVYTSTTCLYYISLCTLHVFTTSLRVHYISFYISLLHVFATHGYLGVLPCDVGGLHYSNKRNSAKSVPGSIYRIHRHSRE
jgi:hypothetical protein